MRDEMMESDRGEEVSGDADEERHVIAGELGQVAVVDGPEGEQFLAALGVHPLQGAGGAEDALDRSHAEVVVVLQAAMSGSIRDAISSVPGRRAAR